MLSQKLSRHSCKNIISSYFIRSCFRFTPHNEMRQYITYLSDTFTLVKQIHIFPNDCDILKITINQ